MSYPELHILYLVGVTTPNVTNRTLSFCGREKRRPSIKDGLDG